MSGPMVLPRCPRLSSLWLLPQGLPALQALEEGSRASWLQSVLDSGNWTRLRAPQGQDLSGSPSLPAGPGTPQALRNTG